MVKKLSALMVCLFGSILILFGCGDPYKDFNLSVSKTDVILYLDNDNGLPKTETLEVVVNGAGKGVSTDVEFSQYGTTGVNDLVSITDVVKNGKKTIFTLNAKNAGKGIIYVNSIEGNKRAEINVTVYIPISNAEFILSNKAVKYGGEVNLNNFVSFTPSNTNQTEMDFFISDETGSNEVTDEEGRTIETDYAKIVNGKLISKPDATYPFAPNGLEYVNVYGVSKHNKEIVTEIATIYVVNVIDSKQVKLFINSEETISDVGLVSSGNNVYDIILGSNSNNPYIFARDLKLKIGDDYATDQKYSISYSYDNSITSSSVFQVTSKVSEESRYNYNGLADGYPYKILNITQLNNGVDYFEIKIDRVGFEGLFTLTFRIRVTVKQFGSQLNVLDEYGVNLDGKFSEIYNAYGGTVSGTPITLGIEPNNAEFKIFASIKGAPQVGGNDGIVITLKNNTVVNSKTALNNGTTIYLKHYYSFEELQSIITDPNNDNCPKLVVTYSYNLAPTSVTTGYKNYILTKEIPLVALAGVSDIEIPTNSSLKINSVTGKAVGIEEPTEPDAVYEIVLATIGDKKVNLNQLIESITAVSINGKYESDFDPFNNRYFKLDILQNTSGFYNRIVVIPNLQPSLATIELEIKTKNNITKNIIIEMFVPIVYEEAINQEKVHIDFYDKISSKNYIYESTYKDYIAELNITGGINIYKSEDYIENELKTYSYQSLDSLTLSINSSVGFNVFNYVILSTVGDNYISSINYNSNVTIVPNRDYYTVEYRDIGGVKIPYIIIGSIKTIAPIELTFKLSGYNNNGAPVTINKTVMLTIVKPITNIQLNPVAAEIYESSSVGYFKEALSNVDMKLNIYPSNAYVENGNISTKFYIDEDLVLLERPSSDLDEGTVKFLLKDFVELKVDEVNNTCSLVARISKEVNGEYEDGRKNKIKRANGIIGGVPYTFSIEDLIDIIYNKQNFVVTVYANLNQYDKPTLSSSAQVTIKYAEKVKNIIPSVSDNGLYFDSRDYTADLTKSETITFKVEPNEAFNKTLIATIMDTSVATIVEGVDNNGRIISDYIKIRPNINAGRTTLRIAPEDSYTKFGDVVEPSVYNDISLRVADGSKEYPFEISSANDFLEIGDDINMGNNKYYYVLSSTISLRLVDFVPFGKFDGGLSGLFKYDIAGINYSNQYSINNLNINKTFAAETGAIYNYGIFKELGQSAEIENLILNNSNINLNITNNSYTGNINVGFIAGKNYGKILNSQVIGNINVFSEAKNVNIGGMVGENLSLYEIKFNENGSNDLIIDTYGVISGNAISNSTVNGSNANAIVNINFVGAKANAETSNINIGGVVGSNKTLYKHLITKEGTTITRYLGNNYTNETIENLEQDVSVYARIYGATIDELNVVSTITSLDENKKAYNSNLGGVIGYANSSYLNNIVASVKILGHSNVGGLVGKMEHSIIDNSIVEFANAGQTGKDTVSLLASSNLGGLVGYGDNISIYYSYVRSYFNDNSFNDNYFGNIALLENNTVANKYVGGLVGYLTNSKISASLKNLGIIESGIDISLPTLATHYEDFIYDTNLINNITANGIFNSYFNADINLNYNSLSGNVYSGGIVGGIFEDPIVSDETSTQISNSYVYGNISNRTSLTFNAVEYVENLNYYIGNAIEYKIGSIVLNGSGEYEFSSDGNNLVKIEKQFTEEEITDPNNPDNRLLKVLVTYTQSNISGLFVGNEKLKVDTVLKSSNKELTKGNIITETTTNEITNTIVSELNKNIIIYASYAAINANNFAIVSNLKTFGTDGAVALNGFEIEKDIVTEIKTVVTEYETKLDDTGKEQITDAIISQTFTVVSTLDIVKPNLSDISNYASNDKNAKFTIINIPKPDDKEFKDYIWLLFNNVDGISLNNGYPVLFKYNHDNGEILFKVLPTNINANFINLNQTFSNLSYIVDNNENNQIVLFYNQYLNGRQYPNVNKYKILSSDENRTNIISNGVANATEIIKVMLDLPNLSQYGIIADYEKDLIITSSNPEIVNILSNGVIETLGVGTATITIASKLDVTIYDTVNILVENGISDFNLYKTKNVTTTANTFSNNAIINEFIDNTSNYYVDVVNSDKIVYGINSDDSVSIETPNKLMGYNANYVKNNNVGYNINVSGTGKAVINGIDVEINKNYNFFGINEFSFKGTQEGSLNITFTPFIKSENPNFGKTLLGEGNNLENCIVISELIKRYTFNIKPKAERIGLDKTSATLDPNKYVDINLSLVTSNFSLSGNNLTVNEIVNGSIIDNTDSSIDASFNFAIKSTGTSTDGISFVFNSVGLGEGTNNSLIDMEILNVSATVINELKLELNFGLRLSFNTEKYKDRTNDVTYNINNVNYDFSFSPQTNQNIFANFNLKIVPRPVKEIKASFYPNSETSGSGENVEFNPQEVESEFIVPSRLGLLKFELLPDLNDAEYVELKVSEEFKQYVSFKQKLAIMENGENGFINGYEDISGSNEYLPNFVGIKLKNQSLTDIGNIIYNGKYYVQVLISAEAPVNSEVTFTLTAYKTVNGAKTQIISKPITLIVQPLPSISLTVNGEKEGLLNVGGEIGLEINATNFEGDVEFDILQSEKNMNNVRVVYNAETNTYSVNSKLETIAGETITVIANASRYINGTKENAKSSVKLTIVEYIIDDVYLQNSSQFGNSYNYEILNGTTNNLTAIFNVTYNENNTDVLQLKNVLELEASGKKVPNDRGSYVNNWYKLVAQNTYESLTPTVNYNDFEFMDKTLQDLNSTHFYAIKALKVSTSSVIGFKVKYFYNESGVPQLYFNEVTSSKIYEKSFDVTLIIKDNSTYDHPSPISNVSEFMALGGLNVDGTNNEIGAITTGHYILTNDLVLTNYTPFMAQFSSLDGNGHVIKINSFNTSKYKNNADVNVGLFEQISETTVIKNITIDVSPLLITQSQVNELVEKGTTDENGNVVRNAKIDLSNIQSFNFGMLAGVNNGSITNAKIINTKSTNMLDSGEKNLFIYSTLGYLNNNLVDGKIGGLVAQNNGSISNSYIGLNSVFYENGNSSNEYASDVSEGSKLITTYPFNLVGGKNISGLVSTNSGIIANSYNLGTGLINRAIIFEGTLTAGFVGTNSENGYIFNCMAEGIKTENYRAKNETYIEAKGYIGGFVYNNEGKIENAYSNIGITTNSGGSGGFVYNNANTGKIINAYTTSPNAFNSKSHGQFTGIDSKNNYNNFGKLTSCYYLVLENEVENNEEPATAIRGKIVSQGDSENATDNPFRYTGSFNGFDFAAGNDSNNIWKLSEDTNFGPRLISTSNYTTFSHRVLQHTTAGENNTTIYNYEYDNNCKYGTANKDETVTIINPLLVNTAEEFVKFIINNSKTIVYKQTTVDTYAEKKYVEDKTMYLFGENTGVYYIRLINDLNFNDIVLNNLKVDGKLISDITFAGVLEGNGMSMSGIKLVDLKQEDIHENYGLFSQVGVSDEQINSIANLKRENINPAIQNINITINGFDATQSVKVGAIAGSMYNTSLINVTLNGGDGVEIRGRNLVGGIAGLIKNTTNALITNVSTNNITVTTSHRSNSQLTEVSKVNGFGVAYNDKMIKFESYYNNNTNVIEVLRKYSYAGSIAGVIEASNRTIENSIEKIANTYNDDFTFKGVTNSTSSEKKNIRQQRTSPEAKNISNITVSGGGFIAAEQAGGMFGYVGPNTHIKNSKYLVGFSKEDTDAQNKFQQIRGYNYAGGIVGENYGMLEQVSVEHISELQVEIDKDYVNGTKNVLSKTDLFGNDVGVAIGGLAGMSDFGVIVDSYNKVDVKNSKAKIAGGIIGIATRTTYLSHVYTTSDVYASFISGGVIGVYNKTGLYVVYDDLNKLLIDMPSGEKDNPETDDIDESKKTIEVYRLAMDYVIAANNWGTEIKQVVFDNLKNYYAKENATEGAYYNFVLRMPEFGNQKLNISLVGPINDSKFTKYAGSLIGRIENGTSTLSEDDTNSNETSFYIITTNGCSSLIIPRKIRVVNNGQGTNVNFSSVISTTFNGGKITNNISPYSNAVDAPEEEKALHEMWNNNFNELPTNDIPSSINPNIVGDKIHYFNSIGNQLKLNTILGTAGTNSNMFNSFIWDTIDVTKVEADSGSTVWMILDTFPEYIIGIYSNFNEIKTYNDFNEKLRIVNETKNQFYLLGKNDGNNVDGSYNFTSEDVTGNLSLTDRPSLLYNKFEGTLIGNPYSLNGNTVNPKIVFKNANELQNIFKEINNSTIMNVDFDIHIDGLSDSKWDGNEIDKSSFGILAKNISNSVISNCNINLYFEGAITSSDINVKNFGLVFGSVKDSTISNLKVNCIFQNNDDITFTKNTNTEEMFNFGLVGYGLRTILSNIDVISYNQNLGNTIGSILVNNNTKNKLNIGSIAGLLDDSAISNINTTKFVSGGAIDETRNNLQLLIDVNETDGCKINYGGLVGNLNNSTISESNYVGKMQYGKSDAEISTELNLGGIVGYANNARLLKVMFNGYNVLSSNELLYYAFNNNIDVYSSTSYPLYIGGLVGYGSAIKISGNEYTGDSKLSPKIVAINASNINIVSSNPTNMCVGGIAGYLINKNDNPLGIQKAVNAGNINIDVSGKVKDKNIAVGGIVGDAMGGGFNDLYSTGNLEVHAIEVYNEPDPKDSTKTISVVYSQNYMIGGLFGRLKTTDSESKLTVNNFVSFGDILLKGKLPDKNAYIGGVSGTIEGNLSKVQNGYTLSRIYNLNEGNKETFANNEYINGISYVNTFAQGMLNNVYYVHEFMPYSNLKNKSAIQMGGVPIVKSTNQTAKFGGISYGEFVNVLKSKIISSGNFENNNSDYAINVPVLGSVINFETIAQKSNPELLFKGGKPGSKLNPIVLNSSSTAGDRTLKDDYYYLLDNDNSNDITLKTKESLNCVVINRTTNTTPKIKFDAKIINNYGIFANFTYQVLSTANLNGALFTNNYGNISNVITYGNISQASISGEVSTFVHNNFGNIVASGSMVMLESNAGLTATKFSGFVMNNKVTETKGNAFIKDCYSISSYINTDASATNSKILNAKSAGLVYENSGVIETSFYSGTLNTGIDGTIDNTKIGNNVLVYDNKNEGKINNCYYDANANPSEKGASFIKENEQSKLLKNGTVRGVNTSAFTKTISEDVPNSKDKILVNYLVKYGLSVETIDSQFASYNLNYNYGYPCISWGAKINTLGTGSYSGSNYSVFKIFHAGQLQNIEAYYQTGANTGFSLLTNINAKNVNFGNDNTEVFTPIQSFSNKILIGNNFNITNLKINNNSSKTGLFTQISNSIVYNLKFNLPSVTSGATYSNESLYGIGILAGEIISGSVINNVSINDGTITASNNINSIGLIAGVLDSSQIGTENLTTQSSGTINTPSANNVGGIVGHAKNGSTIVKISFQGTVTGSYNVGGIVGFTNGTSKNNIKSCILVGSCTVEAKSATTIDISLWNSNYSSKMDKSKFLKTTGHAGGIIGKGEMVEITGSDFSSAGNIIKSDYGVGAIAGGIYNSGTITVGNDIKNIIIYGKYAIGGVSGIISDNAIINGNKTVSGISIGASDNNTNYAIGGIVGYSVGGQVSQVNVTNTNIYGSRMVGGAVGYVYDGKVTAGSVNNNNLHYKSNLDMDEIDGYHSAYNLGGASTSTSFAYSNFDNNFRFSADEGGTTIYGQMDSWKGQDRYLEYGGNESKTKNIRGRRDFKLFFGYIAGGVGSGVTTPTTTSLTGNKISNIYDTYYKYTVHQIDSSRFTDNWFKFYLQSEQFQRIYNITSTNSTFKFGTNSYNKGGSGNDSYVDLDLVQNGTRIKGPFKTEEKEERISKSFTRIPASYFNKHNFPQS